MESSSATDLSYQPPNSALLTLNSTRSSQSTDHFSTTTTSSSNSTSQPHPSPASHAPPTQNPTPPLRQASSSAPTSPSLDNHPPHKPEVAPPASTRDGHQHPPPSPYKTVPSGSTSTVPPQYLLNAATGAATTPDSSPPIQPPQIPPRTNVSNHKPQFPLPPALFAPPPGASGFQVQLCFGWHQCLKRPTQSLGGFSNQLADLRTWLNKVKDLY